MYFVERYLRVLKGWVRQMARPESCIAEGYMTYEAMKFAASTVPVWIQSGYLHREMRLILE
jgi:hypothetical protein